MAERVKEREEVRQRVEVPDPRPLPGEGVMVGDRVELRLGVVVSEPSLLALREREVDTVGV